MDDQAVERLLARRRSVAAAQYDKAECCQECNQQDHTASRDETEMGPRRSSWRNLVFLRLFVVCHRRDHGRCGATVRSAWLLMKSSVCLGGKSVATRTTEVDAFVIVLAAGGAMHLVILRVRP